MVRPETSQFMHDAAPALAEETLNAPASAKPRVGLWQSAAQTALPFLVLGMLWEVLAHAGLFPRRLFPPLEDVADTFVRLSVAGILPHHAVEPVARLVAGFLLAAVACVTLGIVMGRS